MTATAIRDGDNIIVTIPVSEAQALRIALQPCPCKATKSHATAAIRDRFVRGLGMAMFRKPKHADQSPTG